MRILVWLAPALCLVFLSNIPRPLPAQETGAADESEVAAHMHDHLERITEIKSQIIAGNLEAVREPAGWFAEHETVEGLPDNFQPYIELMREYARQVVEAADIQTAADAASKMARTCGNCHLTNHVDLEFGFDETPSDWADTITHMQRHQWAADRLWEGLIGPSDTAWNRGSNMLVDVPLHPSDVVNSVTSDVDLTPVDELARRVHLLGGQGTSAGTPDGRSGLYGEMLALCAECHTRLGNGPGQ